MATPPALRASTAAAEAWAAGARSGMRAACPRSAESRSPRPPAFGYGVRAAVATLPRVLLHRLVDEVVDAALELARHLLERLPEHVAALERAGALLVRIRAHRLSPSCLRRATYRADSTPGPSAQSTAARTLPTHRTSHCSIDGSRQHHELADGLDGFGLRLLRSPAFGTSHDQAHSSSLSHFGRASRPLRSGCTAVASAFFPPRRSRARSASRRAPRWQERDDDVARLRLARRRLHLAMIARRTRSARSCPSSSRRSSAGAA